MVLAQSLQEAAVRTSVEVVWRLRGLGVPTSKSAGSHGGELVTEAEVSH